MSSAKHTVADKTERRTSAPRAGGDAIWETLRSEAEAAMAAEPALTGFIYATVSSHSELEEDRPP